jgi:hypothetical protein
MALGAVVDSVWSCMHDGDNGDGLTSFFLAPAVDMAHSPWTVSLFFFWSSVFFCDFFRAARLF